MKNFYSLKTLTRTMQSFLVMMLVTLMAVGNVIGQTTYSHTITAKTWSELGTQSLNGVDWTASSTSTPATPYFGFNADKGQQFGSNGNPYADLTLTTNGINGTITSVKVNTSGNASVVATLKVKVGDTYFTSDDEESVDITATATDYTFTGSAEGAISLEWEQPTTTLKAIYLLSIEVTYEGAPVAVETPTFTPTSGTYYAAQTVTIACATEGANIYYTLDGSAPTANSTLYTAPIAIDSTMTVKAIAINGTDTSNVASATYTLPAFTELANLAAFKRQTSTTELFKVNSDLTVIFQSADKYHTFVQDDSAAIYVYGTLDKAYNAGDKIAGGIYGKYSLYKQMKEMKPVSGTPLADGVEGREVEPIVVTLADLIENYDVYEGKLVTVQNVTVVADATFQNGTASGVNVSQDSSTIQIYSTFKNITKSLKADAAINATGLVIRHDNTIEIAPRFNKDIEILFAEIPYVLDFDDNTDDDFLLTNGTNTNKWFVGQAQGFDNNKLFISSTNGATNKYDVSAASNVKASRNLIIPEKGAVLSFSSRVNGEEGKDMLNVYLYNYTNNILNTEPSWEVSLVGENDWTEHTYALSPEFAGEASLVFEWVNNNNGGEQFPAAIDNIQIVEAACAQPVALNAAVEGANATITWKAADTTQTAWTFEYKLEDHSEWYTVNSDTTGVVLSDLQGSSVYDMRVKSNCGDESSEWVEGQFEVGCLNTIVVMSDTTVTIGTGTSGFYYLFPGFYGWQYTAVVYDITKPGTINDIAFYLNSASSTTGSTMQIWVKAVDADYQLVSTNTFASMVASAREIYNDAPDFTTAGWKTFPISGGLAITEGQKLMVLVRGVGCTTGGGCSKYAAYTTTSTNTVWYDRADNNDPGQERNAYTMSGNRPNIKMNMKVSTVSCDDQLACEVPTNVTVKDVATEEATITWNGDAESYALEYKTGEEDWTAVTVNDTTYTLTGLTQKTTYTVRVKALCGENDYSLYTEEVEFTTKSVCPVVTDITTSNLSTTTTISWTPGSEENAWIVRFRPVGTTEWVELPRISGIPSTTFGGLLDQTDYEVEIMALCDPNDEENQSSWESYTFTSGCAAFDMPYLEEFETAEQPACWSNEGITFEGETAVAAEAGQWLMSPPITIPANGNSYIVLDVQGSVNIQASYRGTLLSRFSEVANVGNDEEMQHLVIQVPDMYKDKAVNFLFMANDETTIEAIEFTQCAFVPAELTAYDPTNTSVELTWTGVNNEGWILEYAEAGSDNWTSVNIDQTGDTAQYTLTGLNGATAYDFRVRTVCAGGSSSQPSEVATITTHCDPIGVPYTHFSSSQDADFECWNNYYSGTYEGNGAQIASSNLKMYNYYNRTTDASTPNAFGNVYAVLPKFDTTLNVLQINFAYKQATSNSNCKFQLGVVTDVNHPMETFRALQEYTAGSSVASTTYILNNATDGNLAFRLMKDTLTQDVRISNIFVEYIPACQRPSNLVATPTNENTMDLTWSTIGIQRNWDIKYKETQNAFDYENEGTLVTANMRPRTITNLNYGSYYTFYIRNHCSATEQSEWIGPFTYQLVMNYNIANAADITTCHGNVMFEADTNGTNTLVIRPSSDGSWVTLNGNVQLNGATLKVYDGNAVAADKLIATYTGSTLVNVTPKCATELTLELTNVGNTAPVLNLAIQCADVPTCSAPSKPELDIETLTLTWEAGCWGTPESYNIEMIDATSGSTTTLTSDNTSLVVNMPNDHSITFRVQPVCDGENGDWSEESEEYVKFACGAPTEVTATFDERTQEATITWTPFMSNQRNFVVEYKLHDAYTWVTATVNNATTFTTPALDELQTYDVRVKAICGDEESDYTTTTMQTPCVHGEQGVVMAQLGNGTLTNSYIPLARYWYNSYTQQLFTQEELEEQGIFSGMTIQSISFNYYSSTATDVPLKLALANTDVTSLSSSFVSNNDFTEVFSSDWVHFDNSNDSWFTIQIDPFVYTGGNLIVSILKNYAERNTSHWTYGSGQYFYLNSQTGKTREYHNDNTAATYTITFNSEGRPYAGGSVQSGTSYNYRANVKFGVEGIVCNPVVSCPAPSNLAVASTEIIDQVEIKWNHGGNEANWTVVYTLNNGEEVNTTVTDTFITITGLEPSTAYTLDISVYANCDETHQSEGVSETFNFSTPCSAFTIPYFEGFENGYVHDAVVEGCISQDGTSPAWTSANSVQNYNREPRTGNGYAYLRYGATRWMFIPVTLEAGRNYNFSMYAHQDASSGCSMKVSYGTDATANAMVNEVVPTTNIGSNWVQLSGTISPTATRTYYVGIYATLNYTPWYVSIDDISIEVGSSCVPPTTFAFAGNTLTWHGNADNYTLKYREAGTEEFTTVTMSTASYTFTGLAPQTTYEYQVQSDCGADGISEWTSLATFTTPCSAFDMPFEENFETTTLSCWTAQDLDGDGEGWFFATTEDGNRMIASASYDNDTYSAIDADNLLISPAINVTTGAALSFKVLSADPNYLDHYSVYVTTSLSDFSAATVLVNNMEAPGELTEYSFDLSAFDGQTIYVIFRHNDYDEFWFLLDDVSVMIPPTCSKPIELAFANDTLSWEVGNIGTPTGYNVRYRLEGEETWTTATTTENYYVFENLQAASSYQVEVQTNCGNDDLSYWSSQLTFTTPCGVIAIPYTQDFEATPVCWTQEEVEGTHNWVLTTNSSYGSGTQDIAFTHVTSGTITKLITPQFDLSANRPVQIRFKHSQVDWLGDQDVLMVYYRPSSDDMWSTLATYEDSFYMREDVIELPAEALTSTCQIAFEGHDAYGHGIYIDDFVIEYAPSCFAPENLAATDIAVDHATITWSDSHNQENYVVEYKEADATDWTVVSGDTTHTVTLTNLTETTAYTVRIKAVCGQDEESDYTDEITFSTIALPATLPYQCGFDNAEENGRWQFVNGTQTNQWAIGTATGNGDNTALYVSNDNGESNAYTITSASDVWIYRDIDVDSSYTYHLSFDWKGNGESSFDYMRVYIGERSPVAAGSSSAPANSTMLGAQYMNRQNEWTTFTTDIDNTFAGHKRLYFYWRNDTSTGNQEPAAVDNISIVAKDKDLQIVSVEPINDNCDLSNAEVTIKVENHSYSDVINGFTAMYVLNGTDTVSETVNATIAPNRIYTYTFATTPAFVDGSNDLEVSVVYDEDMNLTNNSLVLTDVRQVVPASVPYEQDFSNVVLGRDAWTQGTENDNPNLWINNNGVMTFMDNDTMAAQNYFITHCIEIPAGQVQVSYDYNALSSLSESMNVYMGTTPDITTMTLIGSDTDFVKADEDYTYNYLFDNDNAGVYYFAVEATSQAGNMGITFDNLTIMPMIDVTVIAGPNGTVSPLGLVKVPYNGDLTINIIPDNMYHVAGVWVDGERVMNEDQFNASFMMYTLSNIDTAHTINVEFKQEFHIFKYVYNYNDQYEGAGGNYVGDPIDTTTITSNVAVQFTADEHYTLHSLVVGITPPASEGALIDGTDMIADVTYDEATRTYTYIFDTLYVSNYYVQACFKMDTVNIHYRVLTGAGVFDGEQVAAGESYDTWVDYGGDHTSTIEAADGYYTMAVTVNAVNMGIIDHYDFDSIITTQYVTAQFGHMVTASISNYNGINYLGSDEVRGTIEPDTQMVLSGSSCSVSGTVQEHFHLQSFLVNGVDMLASVDVDSNNNFIFTIDSLVENTNIEAEVQIDQVAIYYTVDGGNGFVNGNEMNAVAYDTLYIDYMSSFLSTFEAAEGYHIVNVMVNGVSYDEIPQWLTEYITDPQTIVITFALNEYDITTMIHGNGTVSPGAHVVYDLNSSYVFIATPDQGYHFSQILRNNVSLPIADPEATFTDTIAPVLNNYNYVAYVVPNIYTVTATAGANGTIDPYGAQNYEYGATPTFTVIPDAGYQIDEVLVDGVEVELTDNAYTFEALTGNHTITATFTQVNFTITASAGNNGTINPSGEVTVAYGSMPTFAIAPAPGYEIADVTVDGVSVGAVSTYAFEPVTADHTINATFSKINLTITASASANGTITPSGNVTVEYGNAQTFTVAANDGYEVDYVLVDGESVALTNNSYTFNNVTENHAIFVVFKASNYTITVTDPENGNITPNGVVTVGYNATPTFTIMPTMGYEVTSILVDNNNVIANAEATVMGGYNYTFAPVTANHTLTATMSIKKFNIVATAGANGSITPAGTTEVNYGATQTYTITPDDGYVVETVTVDGLNMGAVSAYTFYNVTANHQISVTFKAEPCVKPSNLQVINIDSTTATLTWYHPGADSYDIQYKTLDAATWTLVQNVPGFAYELTNLQSNTTYVCKVKANTPGCTDTDWSNAVSFKTNAGPSTPDGIADYVKNHVNVYAEHNRVHIINDYSVDINTVAIYDMYGKLIYSGNAINNPEVIELNVAIGTYVVRLTTEQGPAVYKVHINR